MFLPLTTPSSPLRHKLPPMAKSRHDWALYIASNIHEQLHEMFYVYDVKYYFHTDTVYDRRYYFDFPSAGRNLSVAQRAANKEKEAVLFTVG